MKKSIIILEDESIIALMLKRFLASQNYTVIGIAKDGDTAIQLLKNSKPDLIIMDVHIKGEMNGIDTYKIIQKSFNIPAIFLTGNPSQVLNIEKIYPNVLLLEKPVSLSDLKRAIDIIFSSDRKWIQPPLDC